MAAYAITAAAPMIQGACVIIGAPSPELTLVLLGVPGLLELPVTAAADPDEVSVEDEELDFFADELDPVVDAATPVELPPAPAVIVTAVLVMNSSTSDGLVKLVISTVELEYGEVVASAVIEQTPLLESVIWQFSVWVLDGVVVSMCILQVWDGATYTGISVL